MLSYDFQAGTYTEDYYKHPDIYKQFLKGVADIILKKGISGTMLEAGTGEATSLIPLLHNLSQDGRTQFDQIYAFDISWSRIKAAKQFGREQMPDVY